MKENINNIDLNNFMEQLKKESDRGVVLISTELIDIFLTNLLERSLILGNGLKKDILEGPTAILNSFSSKIKIAYSIGLIEKEIYDNLEYVRRVRNIFAHRIYNASFISPEIIGLCKKIILPEIFNVDPNDYRTLFYRIAYLLAGYLYGRVGVGNNTNKQE